MSAKGGGQPLFRSRRFAPLFGTQFLGAFNDNVFKTALFVMISFYGLGKNGFLPAGQMLNLGALLFILPYFLFSALSGRTALIARPCKTDRPKAAGQTGYKTRMPPLP